MIRKIKFGKRAETESSIMLDAIQMVLGAIVFLFIVSIIAHVLQYFWPPADTNLIALNTISNNIQFATQNFDTLKDNTGKVAIAIPVRLDTDYSVQFQTTNTQGQPVTYSQICLDKAGKGQISCKPILSAMTLTQDSNDIAQVSFLMNSVYTTTLQIIYLSIQKTSNGLYVLRTFNSMNDLQSYYNPNIPTISAYPATN